VKIDATRGALTVFTFKEGFLSPVAHDLELQVQRFAVEIDEAKGEVDVRIDASSLLVRGAVRNGRLDTQALSQADRRTIAETIRKDVLKAGRHPEIRYTGRLRGPAGHRLELAGSLTLVGVTRPLSVSAERHGRSGEHCEGEVVLHQPDFGIRPYSAMLGALKIRPDVFVRFSLPLGTAALV
jgi:polyisoprenoid-binding protein YceI